MGVYTRAFNLLFGRPLATSEERTEHIGPLAAAALMIDYVLTASVGISTSRQVSQSASG